MVAPAEAPPIAVVVFLSGSRRGITQRLVGDELRIGTAPDCEIRLPRGEDAEVAEHHATLLRRGQTYELVVEPGREVWVDGEPARDITLVTGDVLEIGRAGAVLRFRLHLPGSPPYKTMAEAFADCYGCAIHGSDSTLGRAGILLTGAPRELATQTSIVFRAVVVTLLLLLAVGLVVLSRRSGKLERQLAGDLERWAAIDEIMSRSEDRAIAAEDVAVVRAELEARLLTNAERLEALELRSGAAARTIRQASGAVVFLQGAFGFVEPQSGRFLRFAGLDAEGQPRIGPLGQPRLGLEVDGPVVESLYTGTAFVATADGLLLTNRHVALPWEHDESAVALAAQGLEPRMRRFVGFLPGSREAFEVELVAASDEADVALLRCEAVAETVPHLELASLPPQPGDEVIVLGYPTGIRALLARTEEAFVESLMGEPELDFWEVAKRLSLEGRIGPLASRGIVGQVSGSAVVYDAETTQGGSGGPVVDLTGRVVAINAAILPEFGGSNLGVPAAHGARLLELASRPARSDESKDLEVVVEPRDP